MSNAPAFLATVALAFLVARAVFSLQRDSKLKLPPGPRGGLIMGIKNMIPSTEPWKTYFKWSQEYGDVISFRIYKRRFVVLNSREAIADLLEKKAETYSDRPMSWMYNVVCDRGKAIFNISASDPRHKQYRKLLQSGLGIRATRDYLPLIQQESRRMALGLIGKPEALLTHIQRNTAAVIMKVAFGYTIGDDDPFISVAEEASRITAAATRPGRWWVDHHPIIRHFPAWLPGMGWKRQGLAWRARLRNLSEIPHQWMKDQMKTGVYADCFTSRHLVSENGEPVTPEEEDVIKWCAGALYAGAGDTTVSAIVSFVLLMALHPEVQRKAQDEIRATFGDLLWNESNTKRHDDQQHAVDLSHIARLPYLNAVMKEVLRFAPVGNFALPHCVTEDDAYRGYLIPKDTTVIANVWAVLHNPSLYPDPFTFDPDRFTASPSEGALSGQSKPRGPQPDPKQWAFGFGKRACPGIHFAETTMLFAMFNVLSRCFLTLPEGSPRPEIEFTTGITSHVKEFPIVVQPLKPPRVQP